MLIQFRSDEDMLKKVRQLHASVNKLLEKNKISEEEKNKIA